jgi:PPM family protein phosphatase
MVVRFQLEARYDTWRSDLLLRFGASPKEAAWQLANPWRGVFLSDPGCCREINEDRGALLTPRDPQLLRAKGLLAVIADGMGGHAAGEVASSIAVDVVQSAYFESGASPRSALVHAFAVANQAIFEEAQSEERRRGMGTTCTALVIVDRQVVWAHVGDSRLYRLRNRRLVQLTEDDSEVRSLIRLGWITAREARRHPQRNILRRALGVEPEVQVACSPESLQARWGDRYLLCSDGLHDVVEERELGGIVGTYCPEEACPRLIELARGRGGPDNITALIVGTQ